VRPEVVHLTLKFLGDTDESLIPQIVEAIVAAVDGIPPFSIRLIGTGAFPNLRRMTVLWVGIEGGERLVAIAGRLEDRLESLGFPRERREFSPHVTVARVRGGHGLDAVRAVLGARSRDAFGAATVDRVRLMKSVLTPEGAEYFTLEEVPLR